MNRSFFRQVAPLLLSLAIVGSLVLVVRKFEREAPRPFDRLLVEVLPEVPELDGWPSAFLKHLEAAHEGLGNVDSQRSSLEELAYLYHANGFTPQAESCYLGLESYEMGNPLWPYLLGMLKWDWPDKDEIAEHFARAASLEAENPLVHLRLGQAYLEGGWLLEARAAFKKSLEASPDSGWARIGLAQVEWAAGDLEGAEEWLVAAREVEPDIGVIYDLLPEVYLDLGDYERAGQARRPAGSQRLRYEVEDERLGFLAAYCYDANRLVSYAREARRRGELEVAVELVERAAKLGLPREEAVVEIEEIREELGRSMLR